MFDTQFGYYLAHAVSEKQSFQKSCPHPPELAAGDNTSTTFHKSARRKVCGFSFAHIPGRKLLGYPNTPGACLPL